jgi:hypothetical protein
MSSSRSYSSPSMKEPSVSSPEILHVSRALREHGIVHLGHLAPVDEYDCCAKVAIEAYNEYRRLQRMDKDNVVVSRLLN